MTSHPVPENAGHWWLACGKWRRLHAIAGPAITAEQLRTAIDEGLQVPARAACRLRRGWELPGMFSRLGRRRCTRCCHALGVPAGYGTPANEASRKEDQAA